ncbi:MAG: acyloxyacyl hydrolase [Comamonadaceae bacterium]|nr:MAG: acyloxyacyl hydrolase [Comamonadaceae bacterium]
MPSRSTSPSRLPMALLASAKALQAPLPALGAFAVLAAMCAVPMPAGAQDAPTHTAREPRRMFIDGARAASDVGLASVGVQLPWGWHRPLLGGELTGHWDAHIAHWRVPAGTAASERRHWTQLALVPTLRLRFDGGRSAWFVEGGIGLSVLDGRYATRHKNFSTRFNFTDHQGVGFNFGARRQHELMLIVRHVSNGGIRKPNPGEDFVQLRYGLAF